MIVKPQIVNDINKKIYLGIQEQREKGVVVDKVQVMKDRGITQNVKDYVDYNFYYGEMDNVIVPAETRSKLDAMFT